MDAESPIDSDGTLGACLDKVETTIVAKNDFTNMLTKDDLVLFKDQIIEAFHQMMERHVLHYRQ
jgi:hypothetical protein